MASPALHTQDPRKDSGFAFWMLRVLEECEHASAEFAADPVHDLRVALRRCRSMADGLMAVDPDASWKQMKKAGKRLFSSLGELRDAQVMEEWVHKLDIPGDPVTSTLLNFLAVQETKFKTQAALALQEFDRKQWRKWCRTLPRRAARLRTGSAIFRHLALERWMDGYKLHQRALRNRSQVSLHSLRIGIKRFRYIVEIFLPQQHEAWSGDLKDLQDLLGDVHDLDVLWATAVQIKAFPDAEAKLRWRTRIIEERDKRVQKYRDKTLGKTGLWQHWRETLPQGKEIGTIGLQRLKVWASFLDPDSQHSTHVARLALQLYDGLAAEGLLAGNGTNQRAILQLAAILHDVGRSQQEKGHHKTTYKLVHRLTPPLGWSAQDVSLAGTVARYHRGALPRGGQKPLRGSTPPQRQEVARLAGILRLANAFDAEQDGRIQKIELTQKNGVLILAVKGYSTRDRSAETIAAARHLLEISYRKPIYVRPLSAVNTHRRKSA
jgi:exopolyphosphatase/guanosine-5'-triphosphate,3'-diphosphate pyrophosphatase